MNTINAWVFARLAEKSTWLGVAAILAGAGHTSGAAIVTDNMGIAMEVIGLLSVLLSEKGKGGGR